MIFLVFDEVNSADVCLCEKTGRILRVICRLYDAEKNQLHIL